ncbi:AMP-binding protein [Aquincola sp. MAHUQ-54]|uniref:AMP-binding protein n=1 Tax=Aquincola agrisoli TaxID=3119538 RepID=A0AAW9QDI6_9BURK
MAVGGNSLGDQRRGDERHEGSAQRMQPAGAPLRAGLAALLAWRARHQADRLAYEFLPDGTGPLNDAALASLTYAGLQRRAAAVANALRPAAPFGLPAGAADDGNAAPRAVLAFSPGLDFVAALFGCLRAGAIAVPMPTPHRRDDPARWLQVLADAAPAAVLTTSALEPAVQALMAHAPAGTRRPEVIAVDSLDAAVADEAAAPSDLAAHAHHPALLQYTSGSTRRPRGVVVTHGNLAHNLAQIEALFGHGPGSRGLVWLPPYHDMGLVGGILQPLYSGFPVTLMSPQAFLQRPLRWLEAVSHVRATTSGGPDFAYAHAARRAVGADLQGLDLSSWQVAFVGAEPVRAATLARFAETFGPHGFRPEAFLPCYGLAESTLLVAGGTGRPRTLTVDRDALAEHRVVPLQATAAADGGAGRQAMLVGCGAPIGTTLAVVDAETGTPLPDGQVGELWLRGDSVARGYWQAAPEDQALFDARLPGAATEPPRYLRTGDLGFLHDGALYVTGRLRDLVIVRGRNHAPQDLEDSAERSHSALAVGGIAALTATPPAQTADEPGLVLVAEVDRSARHGLDAEAAIAAIRAALSREHGVQAAAIVLVRPQSLPRTPSGKLQRHRCAQGWREGTLAEVARWCLPGWSGTRPGDDAAPYLAWLRDYAEHHLDTRLMDERRSLSPAVVLDFGNRGLLGLQVPAQWGGPGLSHAGFLRVVEQLAAIDATLGLFVGLNNVLGVRPLLRHGTPAQQAEWLPQLASGRVLAAFALTEPGAGSHPHAMRASAHPAADGWRLQGHKLWSGAAAWAGLLNVFVREHDAEGRPAGISAFVLPRGRPGLRQGAEALTMGMRAMVQNAVHLEGVPVTQADRLGRAGEGMAVAQDAMSYGRLTIAAACVGGMKRCAQLIVRYAGRRHVAGGRLLDQPATLARLGELTAAIALLQALVDRLAAQLDAGRPVPEEAYAACKVLAPELYWQAVDGLMQMLGGRGYIESNGVPQMLRDARVLRIFEGPTEALAAHLGACLLRQPRPLLQFAGEGEAGDALRSLAHAGAATAGRQVELGEAAAWAMAWSALHDATDAATSKAAALAWTRARFDAARARALRDPAQEPWRADAAMFAERVAAYADAIGDVDVHGIGEDHAPDALLRRDGAAGGAAAGSARATPAAAHPAAPPPGTAFGIERWLVDWLSVRLGVRAGAIDSAAPMADLGVDSVLAVELVQALEQAFAVREPLDATLAWSHPTLQALAAHVAALSAPAGAAAPNATPPARADVGDTAGSAALDTLTDDELARALAAELAADPALN